MRGIWPEVINNRTRPSCHQSHPSSTPSDARNREAAPSDLSLHIDGYYYHYDYYSAGARPPARPAHTVIPAFPPAPSATPRDSGARVRRLVIFMIRHRETKEDADLILIDALQFPERGSGFFGSAAGSGTCGGRSARFEFA